MASSGVNVLRWSALGLGVFYGIYHQATISASDRLNAKKADWEHKESLINQAKADFQLSKAPKQSGSSSKGSTNPKEDLSAFPWLQESK